ncbi:MULTISPECIES: tRNA uridine-5-carboxymethylaminomethyl(34) synthesis GTPase MnmE [Sphingobium]|uniref:tRNA uridine-5-carboxymethylaminomethyl(34) synthesis GTPase MnmE n=1 Tax=Sphingobium TaxID=165695 RepID=UPI0015EC7273|nr:MULTISPECIES: tRNA uridine-5-carboxymethylaminomethyl(34) synthesis GTPase MnmE [Sphingobium]MCW2363477.1 tRNA modification GTPase [Sphingobium sp. B10D3B]MCW2403124.1 tRNA modification GTPase [Sphingobium sp. B10D7B]MCW2410103.1 tRNA modification GTPase [Sphingobium xanthum]
MTDRDTIFALSSGQLPAAIAIIRVSGPLALEAAHAITGRDAPAARQATLRRFFDPANGDLLDEGLLICFPGPNTETGEDMAEFQCHGSHAVVRALEAALAAMPGFRRAEAGEFTRRAFLSGKMDLAGIEGLGDLIAAETALQRRAAMAMMGGAFSRKIESWTTDLRLLAAQIEAQLDFSDEGDVSGADLARIAAAAIEISADMRKELQRPSADRLRDGIRVAISGPPNAGKSSLFNQLVGRDAAIVSPHAGTTRDVIEASVALNGIAFVLSDSAGLREAGDEIEQIGIGRAEALLAEADIVLWLGRPEQAPPGRGELVQVAPKADLALADREASSLHVSSVTGEGIDSLVEELCALAGSMLPAPGDYALSQRQRAVIKRAGDALDACTGEPDEILVAENLRQVLAALDELTGRTTTELVLDEVFRGFCIGK